jgi:hypothetical protein
MSIYTKSSRLSVVREVKSYSPLQGALELTSLLNDYIATTPAILVFDPSTITILALSYGTINLNGTHTEGREGRHE